MSNRGTALSVAALLLLALPLAAPPAAAHCPPGTAGSLVGPVSTCQFNDELETLSDAIHTASSGSLRVIYVKDFRFHPEVATVKSGGTVEFVYLDDASQGHDPASSGPCADATVNARTHPLDCAPASAKKCFDVILDQGDDMDTMGDLYPLTFRMSGSTVQVSNGHASGTPVVGQPPVAKPFKSCPAGTGSSTPGGTLVAYHCGIHGAAGTPRKDMRAALVVTP